MWSLMKFNTGCFSPALEQMTFLGWMPDRVIDLKTLCKRKICAFKQQSHSQHGKMFTESILSFPRPTTHLYFPTSLAHRCGHIHWVVCSSWNVSRSSICTFPAFSDKRTLCNFPGAPPLPTWCKQAECSWKVYVGNSGTVRWETPSAQISASGELLHSQGHWIRT